MLFDQGDALRPFRRFRNTAYILHGIFNFFDCALSYEGFVINDYVVIHCVVSLFSVENRKFDTDVGPFAVAAGDKKSVAAAII